MKLLLGVLLVVAVSAGPIEECSRGESYWCSSLRKAKACGAVQHCIQTVWSNHPVTHYKGHDKTLREKEDVCEFCENIIGDVRKFVTDNETQAMVTKYMDAACGLIPISDVADKCRDYVKNDIPEIFQMIQSELDPAAVCAALGMCGGFEDLAVQPDVQLNPVPILLQGAPISSKQDNSLPAASPILLQGAPMSNSIPALPAKPYIKGQPTGDICTDCEAFITDIQKMVTNKSLETQVEAVLKQELCSQLGGLAAECNTLVDSYVPEIMELLKAQMDPSTVCGSLGFCSGGDKTLLAVMRLQKSPLYKAAMSKAGEECTVCKVVLGELQDLDRSSSLQGDVETFLKSNLCAKLGDLKATCETTVDEYGPVLFELLAQELDPDTRCKSLGFCSSSAVDAASSRVSEIIRESVPQKQVQKLAASATCIVCEFAMKELQSIINNNSSEAEIETALEKVCNMLPDTIKADCNDFVKQYTPAIVALLEQELDPQQICTALGLCQQKTLAYKPHKKVENDQLCTVCEIAITYVDAMLNQNSTEAEVEQVLDKVCNYLPEDIRPTCMEIVKDYTATLVQLLKKELTPSEVCVALKICDNVAHEEPIKPESAPLLGEKECTYGPAYWCDSRDNAKKCNAVAHCEKHVWNK